MRVEAGCKDHSVLLHANLSWLGQPLEKTGLSVGTAEKKLTSKNPGKMNNDASKHSQVLGGAVTYLLTQPSVV